MTREQSERPGFHGSSTAMRDPFKLRRGSGDRETCEIFQASKIRQETLLR
jgi:hypothetical protein